MLQRCMEHKVGDYSFHADSRNIKLLYPNNYEKIMMLKKHEKGQQI